jgi:hypothetical protein
MEGRPEHLRRSPARLVRIGLKEKKVVVAQLAQARDTVVEPEACPNFASITP